MKDESEKVMDTASKSALGTKQEVITHNYSSFGRPVSRRKSKQEAEKQLHSAKKIGITEQALQLK